MLLGFTELGGWASPHNPCFNSIIGRTAGRNASPGITVDGVVHHLPGCDAAVGGLNPETNLHGGLLWNKAVWRVQAQDSSSVTLAHTCPEGPFPGTVSAVVTYTCRDSDLVIDYEATTTATTPISLTNHAYFNLSAGATDTCHDHTLMLRCGAFSPDNGSGDGVPTGEQREVVGTARDMRDCPVPLAAVIDGQARLSPHWPHGEEFVVTENVGRDPNAVAAAAQSGGAALPLAAVLAHPASGRTMQVFTSEPTLQTYYSTLLDGCGGMPCKGGVTYPKYGAVCLEAQRFANAENIGAPCRLVRPGEVYRQRTVHRFSTEAPRAAA